MLIVLDQDEVLCEWLNTVLKWYNEDRGTTYTRADVTQWDVISCLPNSRDFLRSILRYPETYRDLEPVPGAIDGVKKLIDDGHDVVIATATPKFAGISFHGKLEWIRRNMPFFDLDNFVSIKRKDLLVRQGAVLLDDGPHNLEAWAKSGGYAVAYDHAWNHREIPGLSARVTDWKAFLELIGTLKG
jgi:5'(3')-deoxyribonucleotidase